jgi:hypothetical protein
MHRLLWVLSFIALALAAAGCGLHPVEESFTRYCDLFSHEACLDRVQPRANCVPCPDRVPGT